MLEQLAPRLQDLSSTNNTRSAPISSFGPSPEDLPLDQGESIRVHGGPLMAHQATTEMINDALNHSSPWPVMWDGQWDLDGTSWLAGTDFDLEAVNQSLLESTETYPVDPAPDTTGGRELVQRRWHTFSEAAVSSGQTTPDCDISHNDPCQIHTFADESYREKLAESLRQRVQPGILPSTGFLVSTLSPITHEYFFSHSPSGLLCPSVFYAVPVHIPSCSCANISALKNERHPSPVHLLHWESVPRLIASNIPWYKHV